MQGDQVCIAGHDTSRLPVDGNVQHLVIFGIAAELDLLGHLNEDRFTHHSSQKHFPFLMLPAAIRRHERLRQVCERYAEEVRQFGVGARNMLRWRVLAIGYLLAAAYLVAAGAAPYLVLLGLGVRNVTLEQALAVHCFSLAVGLIVPLPVDIGRIELSGIGALLASGVERNAAVIAMLLFRALLK